MGPASNSLKPHPHTTDIVKESYSTVNFKRGSKIQISTLSSKPDATTLEAQSANVSTEDKIEVPQLINKFPRSETNSRERKQDKTRFALNLPTSLSSPPFYN